MRQTQSTVSSWQTVLLLVAGVTMVIIIAFLLAQMDSYQLRSAVSPSSLPVVDLEATMAAGELSIVYLPSEVTPTPTPIATTSQATMVATKTIPPKPFTEMESVCDQAVDGWFPYIIKTAGSIASLANQYGVSETMIMDANCLSHSQVTKGQQILLPQDPRNSTITAGCDTPPDWVPYTIKPGDTLPKLARTHKTTVYHLVKSNCLQRTELKTGHEIFIPSTPSTMVSPAGNGSLQSAWPDTSIQAATPSWPIATPTFPSTP